VKKIFLVAAALTAIPSAAMAQDAKPFTGPYVGVLAGWDHVKVSDGSGSASKDGVAYGGVLGYDLNLGGAVVGAEAEISGASTKETATNLFTAGDVGEIKAGRDLYVGARVGAVVTPSILLYAKAGYTNARATVDYDDHAGTTFHAADNLNGFRVGAGAEYSFGRFAARAEYRYSDYGNFKYNGVDTGIDAKRHQIVVTALARF